MSRLAPARATQVAMASSRSVRAELEKAARAFAEREARKADLID
jgi:hypothetical protein